MDGLLYAVMVGAAESYMGALAVELGYRDTALALLSTLPLLAGALSQFASARLARLLGSRKRLTVVAAVVQAISHIGLIAATLEGHPRFVPFLLARMLFWISAMVSAPAWKDWMADLTRGVDQDRYFARRSTAFQTSLVAAFVAAGVLLHRAHTEGGVLEAYSMMFGVALVARTASAMVLAMKHDPVRPSETKGGTVVEAIRGAKWRVAVYVAATLLGAHMAAPFITPYLLKTLELDYATYVLLTATALAAKAATFPMCHHLAKRFGMRKVFAGSGVLVAVAPFLWVPFTSLFALYCVEGFMGVAWAGWEYAAFHLLLGSASEEQRLSFCSLSGALSGAGQLLGSIAGSVLLARFGFTYTDVFLASGLGCVASLSLVTVVPIVRRTGWRALFARLTDAVGSLLELARARVRPEPYRALVFALGGVACVFLAGSAPDSGERRPRTPSVAMAAASDGHRATGATPRTAGAVVQETCEAIRPGQIIGKALS